ncbi:MAG: LacI family DNA-binding transcriptional regulator [Akkermansiaceae bacterium]|nr:LacI family DNA-binding transcriptional regulator [Armatimonadota bacterium]
MPTMENDPADTPPSEPTFRAPPRRTRHRDVALRAGVSTATVSKVITGRETDRISQETRMRVLEAVRELNYVPQSAVREMQTGRTGRIGVLLVHPAAFGDMDPYHTGVLSGILAGAWRAQRNTLLYTALEPYAETLRREILGGGADAVLAVGKVWSPLVESIVTQANLPVVYISVLPQESEIRRSVPYFGVDCDNHMGGRLAIEHLARLGHRRIGIILGGVASKDLPFVRERLAGADAAATEAGISLSLLESVSLTTTVQTVAARKSTAPTALFFIEGETHIARLLAEIAPDCGVRIPQDLSVVAFNSTRLSKDALLPVTAVRQPLEEIGACAVALAVDYLDKGTTSENHAGTVVRLPVTLDVRESTVPPSRQSPR